jgi:hypothetical protein
VLLGRGKDYVKERERADQAAKQVTNAEPQVTPAAGSISTNKPEAK